MAEGIPRPVLTAAPATEAVDWSAVVPAYNEAESLPELIRRIREAFGQLGGAGEIIVVDDGSTDATERVLEDLARAEPRLHAIFFRRNFGKSAALAAGFAQARGRFVFTLDADLQDDPAEFPGLLAALQGGNLDVVSGWKRERKDPAGKRIPSKLFNSVVSRVSGLRLHDMNCGLKVYRREVVEHLPVHGELHRFLPALAHWQGFRVGEKAVRHEARRHGRSKFGPSRFVNGFLDLLTVMFLTAGQRSPLHLFGRLGLWTTAVGLLIHAYFFALWIMGRGLRVRPLLLFGVGLILLGIQFVSMGLLAEMIANQDRRREYPVRRRIEGGREH
jgi:glycosyltransferase involved in cell wall biosynthesis